MSERVREIKLQYEEGADSLYAAKYPDRTEGTLGQENRSDIIAAMEKSFADFGIHGENLNTLIKIMPFPDSLMGDTIRGMYSRFRIRFANVKHFFTPPVVAKSSYRA